MQIYHTAFCRELQLPIVHFRQKMTHPAEKPLNKEKFLHFSRKTGIMMQREARKMKRCIRWLALVLTAAIGLCPAGAADTILPQQTHMEISMEELSGMSFSWTEFSELCRELTAAAELPDNREQTEALLAELRQMFLLKETELSIASLRSSEDVTDTSASERYLELLEQSNRVDEIMNDTVLAVLDSPCREAVDQQDSVLSLFTWDAGELTPEEENLYYQEQRLEDAYSAAACGEFTAELDGKLYTQETLMDAWLEGALSDKAYDDGLQQIAMAENDALAGIYLELVENRRQQAALYGYADYGAFQDDYYYMRDYSQGEVAAFSRVVKTYIVPLARELEAYIDRWSQEGAYDTSFTQEELLEQLRRCLEAVSGELVPAADYMLEYGYYDIAWSATKTPGAYTLMLPYTGAPFLMMEPEGDNTDFSTLVHEFGHYNAGFCSGDAFAYNCDLSEIHSQGLELLMLEQYEAVFGEAAPAERVYTLYQMLTGMVDGCMMDELERYAYTEPELTVEKLNQKYMKLLKDYGYREKNDPAEEAYGWVMTEHLYREPLYMVSYAVSAAGALTIWQQSLEDQAGGVETYLRLVALGEGEDFFPTLAQVGMANPLTESSVKAIAHTVEDYSAGQHPPEAEASQGLLQVILVVALVILGLDVGIVAVLIAVKRRRKHT